jgi:hypothetical protein
MSEGMRCAAAGAEAPVSGELFLVAPVATGTAIRANVIIFGVTPIGTFLAFFKSAFNGFYDVGGDFGFGHNGAHRQHLKKRCISYSFDLLLIKHQMRFFISKTRAVGYLRLDLRQNRPRKVSRCLRTPVSDRVG